MNRRVTRAGHLRLAAMILTSTVLIHGLVYLDTCELARVRFGDTRVDMARAPGCAR